MMKYIYSFSVLCVLSVQMVQSASFFSPRAVDKQLHLAIIDGNGPLVDKLLADKANPNAIIDGEHLFALAFDYTFNRDRQDQRITGVDNNAANILLKLALAGGRTRDIRERITRYANPEIFKDQKALEKVTDFLYELNGILLDAKAASR